MYPIIECKFRIMHVGKINSSINIFETNSNNTKNVPNNHQLVSLIVYAYHITNIPGILKD